MVKTFIEHTELWHEIEQILPDGGIIGISGYAGSGKTELAKRLGRDKPGIQLVQVDDYLNWPQVCELTPSESRHDGIDFDSILRAHIKLFKADIKPVKYLIIEGIRLFRPGRTEYFDYHVWVDKSLAQAEALGRRRAEESKNAKLWDIWSQNEQSFNDAYNPRQYANALYDWSSE